jgi:hypothetical protein
VIVIHIRAQHLIIGSSNIRMPAKTAGVFGSVASPLKPQNVLSEERAPALPEVSLQVESASPKRSPSPQVIPGHRRARASGRLAVGAMARKRCTRSTVAGSAGSSVIRKARALLKMVSARRWRSSAT